MSQGFDSYGPVMMMPYASANSQPFINPMEFYDNTQTATPYQNEKKISTDSQLVRNVVLSKKIQFFTNFCSFRLLLKTVI